MSNEFSQVELSPGSELSPKEKTVAIAIRSDVLRRPNYYESVNSYLAEHFGEEAIRSKLSSDWELTKNVRLITQEHEALLVRIGNEFHANGYSKPIYTTVAERFGKPDPSVSPSLFHRIQFAFRGLLEVGIHSDDDLAMFDENRAKAIIFLTWILVDKNAHTVLIGQPWGPWTSTSSTESGKFHRYGREMARLVLWKTDSDSRRRWFALARKASKRIVLSALSSAVPNMPPKGYSIARLREMTGFSNQTVGTYGKSASVKMAGRGRRGHLYTESEVIGILNEIIAKSSSEADRAKAKNSLEIIIKSRNHN